MSSCRGLANAVERVVRFLAAVAITTGGRQIDRLRRGERVIVRMPYGRFTYEVERTRIVQPDALWVTRKVGYERLVLTACRPLYSAAQRIVAFARLVETQT